ncbi:EamA-like transporter family protein [Roseovarius litorisediminis]|uniref:EamA-like transporter family protein n=1 Tax=Roseovarius litorisediminis TaxID=1312363 RepID=A0A1Y5T8V3_9RHOB|nr:DMT family transporter [Roseovarius litorisediminis]SLN58538.1 EamA-like transporter family protein [Roseovarius litorisediminis]
MSGGVFAIVMLAALLHAAWNALVKGGADKTVAMVAVVLGQAIAALTAAGFAPVPNPECWPWLIAGAVLHFGYQIFLVAAYRLGDLTQVYPIARGVSPLLVALASVLFLGVVFSRLEWLAIGMIAIGIASISLVRRADGLFQGKAAVLALTTGGFIASYSIVDGIGARIAGTSLGFYSWLAVLNGIAMAVVAWWWRPELLPMALRQFKTLILGGGASFVAYALVVYAFTHSPIALVTALRETSIVFALLIGVVFLKERLNLLKVAATAATLSGAALLRISKG